MGPMAQRRDNLRPQKSRSVILDLFLPSLTISFVTWRTLVTVASSLNDSCGCGLLVIDKVCPLFQLVTDIDSTGSEVE